MFNKTMGKTGYVKKAAALLLTVILILSSVPIFTMADTSAPNGNDIYISQQVTPETDYTNVAGDDSYETYEPSYDYDYTDEADYELEDDYGLYEPITSTITIVPFNNITIDGTESFPFTVADGETATIVGDIIGEIIVQGQGTLILNGPYTITGTVTVGGTFNMLDGTITGVGTRGVLVTGAGSTFNMSGGYITGNSATTGGGIRVQQGATFNMSEDAIIEDNIASNGAGVYIIDDSAMHMTGGIIRNNHVQSPSIGWSAGGGGIRITGGGSILNISGNSIISGNISDSNGGGILHVSGNVSISGDALIQNNTAEADGGGIRAANHPDAISMSGGFIRGNTANGRGGAVFIGGVGAGFTMTGGVIGGFNIDPSTGINLYQNTALSNGGGVRVEGGAIFTMSGTAVIEGNHSGSTGGGVISGHGGHFIMNSGYIRGNTAVTNGGGVNVNGVRVDVPSTFTMTGGTIEDNTATENGGGVAVLTGANFTMSDTALIYDNTAVRGGGVNVTDADSEFTMTGGTIEGNTATNYGGGGVAVQNGAAFTMSDTALIYDNMASRSGGGVFVNGAYSSFVMTGGTIRDNAAIFATIGSGTATGGGVRVQTGASFHMSEENPLLPTLIYNNRAQGHHAEGGGISVVNSNTSFTMTGGTILDNQLIAQSTAFGGGFHARSNATVEMTGGYVIGNIARNRGGGGVITAGATLDMTGGTIEGNHGGIFDASIDMASRGGGGIYIGNYPSVVNISGSALIYNNTTDGIGGGIIVRNDASLNMSGGTIESNTATLHGGGVAVQSGANFTMSGTALIYDNEAATNGGGVFVTGADSEFSMSGGTIENNDASVGGGILIASGGALYMFSGNVINNSANFSGGLRVNGIHPIPDGSGGFIPVPDNEQTSAVITGGVFENNSATNNGGGIYFAGGSIGFIGTPGGNNNDIMIYNNQANGNGGGLLVHASKVTMYSGTIRNNTANNRGGGVRIAHGPGAYNLGKHYSEFIMHDGLIYDNRVLGNGVGGGVSIDVGVAASIGGAFFTQTGGTIENNTATLGGGVHVGNISHFTMTNGIIKNNTATEYGGGIWTESYNNLNIANTVTFSGNTANTAHDHGIANRGIPGNVLAAYSGGGQGGNPQNIDWATLSIPGTHALNNFDINYTGAPVMHNVTFLPGTPSDVTGMPGNRTVAHNAAISTDGGVVATPSRTGYTFLGWLQTIPAGTGVNIPSANVGNITVTQNMTFVAQWQLNDDGGGNGYTPNYNLVINKSASTPSGGHVIVGGTVTYTITARNNGSAASGTVTITDDIPQGMSLVAGSAVTRINGIVNTNITPTVSGNRLTWTIPSIAVDQTVEVSFEVTVDSMPSGVYEIQYRNTAVINGRDTNTVVLTARRLVKNPNAMEVSVGETIHWTLRNFHNYTGGTVDNFTVIDMPGRGLNFISAQLPAFTNGAGITFDILYTIYGSDEWHTYATGINANQPFSFSLPQPGDLHYTHIKFYFGSVPAGFALGNEMILTFRVDNNAPNNVLINRFALQYRGGEHEGSGTATVTPGGTTTTPGAEEPNIPWLTMPFQTIPSQTMPYSIERPGESAPPTDTTIPSATPARINPQTSDSFDSTGTVVAVMSLILVILSLGAYLFITKKGRATH